MINKKAYRWIIIVGIMLIATACGGDVEYQTEHKQIALDGATDVQTVIDFRGGELIITGAAQEHLLEAEFSHNAKKKAPVVQYSVSEGAGELFLGVPDLGGMGASFGGKDNLWELSLNPNVDLNLRLEVSDADASLNFSNLNLTNISIQQNGRELDVDLSGSHPELTALEFGANSGKGTFKFTGNYIDFESIQATINASVQHFDLRGQWERDCNIIIEGGTNNSVTLDLPSDIGVQVEVLSDKVDVSADGFSQDSGIYTNSIYGETAVTIYLTIGFTSGDLTINQ